MSSDTPPPVFEILFEGDELYPEQIPMRALSDSLAAIQRLASGDKSSINKEFDEEEQEVEQAPKDDSLRLVRIERGSARYFVAGPPSASALQRLRSVGELLIHPENIEAHDDYLVNPVERLSGVARRLDCTIILRELGAEGAVLAKIEPASFENISRTVFVTGETSFVGKVVRVGGATALRCGLRVPFQNRLLICKVDNADIARKIGDCLYEDIVVFGSAVWLKKSWRIYSYTIEGMQQLIQGSIVGAMEALREAGGKDWDLVQDPAHYLDEVIDDQ